MSQDANKFVAGNKKENPVLSHYWTFSLLGHDGYIFHFTTVLEISEISYFSVYNLYYLDLVKDAIILNFASVPVVPVS